MGQIAQQGPGLGLKPEIIVGRGAQRLARVSLGQLQITQGQRTPRVPEDFAPLAGGGLTLPACRKGWIRRSLSNWYHREPDRRSDVSKCRSSSARARLFGIPAVSVMPSYAVPRRPRSLTKVRITQARTRAWGTSCSAATAAITWLK